MKSKFVFILILTIALNSNAQDFHFSQFSENPLLLNPALTGAFDGVLRSHLCFRNQWKKIVNSYETFGISIDTRLYNKHNKNGFFAFGITVMKDESGKSELATTQELLSIAFHLKVDKNSYLIGGIQSGFTQKKVNYSNLLWDNQYDPGISGFNPNLPHKEKYINDGFSYTDVSGGVLYNYNASESSLKVFNSIRFQTGLSYYHFVKTDKSFIKIYNNPMYPKLVLHGKAFLDISRSKYSIIPSFFYIMQGPNQEFVLGAGIKRAFNQKSKYRNIKNETALSLGYLVRRNEAFIPYISFDIAGFTLSLSYDINYSNPLKSNKRIGAFEINLCSIIPN